MAIQNLNDTPYWKRPKEHLPKQTRMYYIVWNDPTDDKCLTSVTALYNTDTGKWTIFDKEVTPLVWGDPYFLPET